MNKKIQKIFLTVFVLLFAFFFMMPSSLSIFDSRSTNLNGIVPIGTWVDPNAPVTPETLEDYLEDLDTVIVTNPNQENADTEAYLYDILFEKDENGDPDTSQINPIYEDYTLEEMIETITLIQEFASEFLVYDTEGNPTFPSSTTVTPVDIGFNQVLMPGQSTQFKQVLLTANNASTTYYSPVAINISIEAPNGEDISDFAVEILIDGRPFTLTSPFSYNYLYVDRTSWNNNRAQGGLSASQVTLNTLQAPTIFTTTAYRLIGSSWQPVNYSHNFTTPVYSGDWSRFPQGPNVYLAAPSGSTIGNQQQFTAYSGQNRYRTGMILMGKANGTTSEIRLDLPIRNPRNSGSAPVIPVVVVVSRGLELDANGNSVANQRTNEIVPIVKVRMIEGQVWS